MARLDEFSLIRRLTSQNRDRGTSAIAHEVEVGIGDDAAVLGVTPGNRLVAACDTMVETVHFNRWTMRDADVGYKAVASNVSDIAAMGGRPLYALASVSIPRRVPSARIEAMYKGLYEACGRFGVHLAGGDTTSAPRHLTVTLTILGEIEPGRALTRSAARPGDVVFVTGHLGGSAAGLDLMTQHRRADPKTYPEPYRRLIREHQRPEPSVQAGRLLLESGGCHALNDISDGLASEAWEIAEASGRELLLYERQLPARPELRTYAQERGKDALDWILFGGEDYGLVGTLKPSALSRVKRNFAAAGLPFFVIGKVTDRHHRRGNVSLLNRSGATVRLDKKGYRHF